MSSTLNLPSGHYVTFGPDANCTIDLCPVESSVYEYRPSLGANGAFIGLFALAMIIHIALGVFWKSWWFMGCMIAGCIDEILGYSGRIMMWSNPWDFTAFMIQIVCITTSPVFFCAAIYITLAKTMEHYSPQLARFPPKYFVWAFIPCDIISLALQGAGGGMSSSSSGSSQIGVDLALAGLGFQVFTLLIFTILFVDFIVRYMRSAGGSSALDTRFKLFFGFLTLAILLIFARCVYRVDELSQGYNGPLISDEGLFVGLEGVLITISAFALCIGHPGLVFSRNAPVTKVESSSLENGLVHEGK